MEPEEIEKKIKPLVNRLEEEFNRLVKEEILQAVKKGIKLCEMGNLSKRLRGLDEMFDRKTGKEK